MPVVRASPQSFVAIETELVGGDVLLTRMRGHVTRLLAEQMFDQFRVQLGGGVRTVWIVEQNELTGFDPGAVPAGARWFSAFKDRGGQRVIFVSSLSAARMVAASLAFAVHAKVSTCETLRQAYELAGLGPSLPKGGPTSLNPRR